MAAQLTGIGVCVTDTACSILGYQSLKKMLVISLSLPLGVITIFSSSIRSPCNGLLVQYIQLKVI